MTEMVDLLRQIPYFAELGPASLRDVTMHVREQKYQRGKIILWEGQPCEGLYFVANGRVKVFKISAEGKEQVLRILGPGRTFNDVPVFDGGPNPGSVTALEASTIGFVPKAKVLEMVEQNPKVAKVVIRVLASRLRALTLVIEDLSLRTVVARVAKVLLDCARGRETVVEGPAGACVRITQREIAAMTGSVREVVQRALKSLEQVGAVKLERAQVLVLDVTVLERLSESAPSSMP